MATTTQNLHHPIPTSLLPISFPKIPLYTSPNTAVTTNAFHPNQLGRLPKLNFPQFDGEHAQFWTTCATNYFDMYEVEPSMWVKVATMHFTGAAKRWLQSVEHLLATTDWPSFYSMIHERFSRDQHEFLLCQLFNIRQSTSVKEYVD